MNKKFAKSMVLIMQSIAINHLNLNSVSSKTGFKITFIIPPLLA